MRRQAGYSLLEVLVAISVVMGILAATLVLGSSARADAAASRTSATVLAILDTLAAGSEFDGLAPAASTTATAIAARNTTLSKYLDADGAGFTLPGGAKVAFSGGRLVASGLDKAGCVSLAQAVEGTSGGTSTLWINGAAQAVDGRSVAAIVAACAAAPAATYGGTHFIVIAPFTRDPSAVV